MYARPGLLLTGIRDLVSSVLHSDLIPQPMCAPFSWIVLLIIRFFPRLLLGFGNTFIFLRQSPGPIIKILCGRAKGVPHMGHPFKIQRNRAYISTSTPLPAARAFW